MYYELLRIKRYREQAAAQAVRRQQSLLDQQAQVVQRAREDTERFHEQRISEEQRLFDAIRNRPVLVKAIEDMNRHSAALREQEALLETRVLDEEKRLAAAREALETARLGHVASVREREKFDQFFEVQRAIEAREQMMREENELEESASATHQARRGVSP